MAVTETDLKSLFADKEEILKIVEEQNRIMGFVPNPHVNIEEMQVRVARCLRRAGIRPEYNDASRQIIADRDDY
jgi:hypothetical protein